MRDLRFLTAAVSLVAIVAAMPAKAQETTSAIAGQVTGANGEALAGAKVTVVHTPSGTHASAVADKEGNFSLRGLRVGGPYTVVVAAQGYADETVDGLSLAVGDTLALPVHMTTQQITVNGASAKGVRSLDTGSASTFKASDITSIVSARRDIRDIVRRDILSGYNPNVGGVSIAGANIRTQRFSVDGVAMQDSFGLNYGGLPSTRGIVSIEMIDQLTVKAAPFDISEGNFQGGAVNVVLKSGTNLLHGSAFGNFGGPTMTGNKTADNQILGQGTKPVGDSTILNFKDYGGSLSGPIIKDKLFFAVSYERLSEGTPFFYGAQGSAAANPVPNLFYTDTTETAPLVAGNSNAYPFGATAPNPKYPEPLGGYPTTLPGLNTLFNTFKTNYGSFPIGDVPTAIAETDRKLAGKLDWNIADGHRFSLSYISHENVLPNWGSGGGSNSANAPNIQLLSDLYKVTEHTDAITAQYNAKWTDRLTSEVRFAYKYYRRGQDPFNGTNFAQFNVCLDPTSSTLADDYTKTNYLDKCSAGTPVVKLGPDTPRQANQFNSHTYTMQGNIGYRLGDHTFKLEFDHMYTAIYNLFVYGTGGTAGTGGVNGLYYFDSIADLAAKQANELVLELPSTGNASDGAVRWAYQLNTLGAQDTWKPASNLTINGGFRYDMYQADNSIAKNANFTARYATLYPGLDNTATLDGRKKFQPRLGFNWTPTPTVKVAGGIGLFAGGVSDVYISNNYSNSGAALNASGATLLGVDIVRTATGCYDNANKVTPSAAVCAAALNGVTGTSNAQAVVNYLQTNTAVLANALTNFLDPNYKIPAQWKYNLSVAFRPDLSAAHLGTGWTFRGDVLFSDTQEAPVWRDLRAQPLVINGVTQVAPDGRPRYDASVGGNYDIELTNTDRGISRVFAIGATKSTRDFDFTAAYTHTVMHDVAGALASSTVSSNYGVVTDSPNSGGAYGRSQFEIRQIIRGSFELHKMLIGDNETRFGVNWEHRSGQPYSITMTDGGARGAVFGTALNNSAHLFYVPDFSQTPVTNALGTQVGNVVFDSPTTYNAVKNLVMSTDLSKYQGQIAPKNLLTGPSYDKVDINLSQQIPLVGRAKLTALFSMENFLNFLNRNWGSYLDYGTADSVVQVTCTGPATNGQACPFYKYSSYNAPTTTAYAKPSLFAVRVGARLDF